MEMEICRMQGRTEDTRKMQNKHLYPIMMYLKGVECFLFFFLDPKCVYA